MPQRARHTIWTGFFIATLMTFAGTAVAGESLQFIIKIDDVIFLSDDEIVSYNWQNHSITVTPQAKERIDSCWPKYFSDEWPPNKSEFGNWPTGFSVYANDEVVYSGRVVFWASSSSFFQMGSLLSWPFFRADSSQIDIVQYDGRNTRSDSKIKDVLSSLGVLEQ
jgi:hypothetical protein